MTELPDLEKLAVRHGWRAEDPLALTISARLLRAGQPVMIVQAVGATQWQSQLPASVTLLTEIPNHPDPALPWVVITDRQIRPRPEVDRLTILRPPTLALGVACRREVTPSDLEDAVRELCRREGFSSLSITALGASARRKRHPALEEWADQRRVPLLLYPEGSYGRLPWPAPGKMARTCVLSAMLAAGAVKPLLDSRPFFGKLTLALARRKQTG
jgi:cobalamin biosynthesis protein CbiG